MECPLCLVQPDTQTHSVLCTAIKANIDVRGAYKEIITDEISQELSQEITQEISQEIAQALLNIMQFRESKRLSQDGSPIGSNDAANI